MSCFEFRETMAGSFHLLTDPADERPMSFTIRARSRGLVAFLRRPEVDVVGEIDAEGFADHRYLWGTLGLDVVRTGTLPYALHFSANDGAPHCFQGKRTLSARDFAQSMSVLPGSIFTADGAEIGRALLRFDVRSDLLRFLRSFRPSAG